MNLETAMAHIRMCSERMEALYGRVVFDEWAVVCLTPGKERIVTYLGPRYDTFQQHFAIDLEAIREEIHLEDPGVGDFEFGRGLETNNFDAFLIVGRDLALICNNTKKIMGEIISHRQWRKAQVPFVELSDLFRTKPLVWRPE